MANGIDEWGSADPYSAYSDYAVGGSPGSSECFSDEFVARPLVSDSIERSSTTKMPGCIDRILTNICKFFKWLFCCGEKDDADDVEVESGVTLPSNQAETIKKITELFHCPIKYGTMENGAVLRQCGHLFDEKSIRQWYQDKQICPTCNAGGWSDADIIPIVAFREINKILPEED